MIKSALTILAVAGTGLFAQGGQPTDVVATVAGQPIEQRDFDHWLRLAAKAEYIAVPDPATGYRRCIAEKRRSTPAKDRRKVTDTQLKASCKEDYSRLR